MHAHEVDFGAADRAGADTEGDGNAGDEGDEFARGGRPDPDVPVCAPAGGFERPVGFGLLALVFSFVHVVHVCV